MSAKKHGDLSYLSAAETARLVEDLRIHQIELDLQNEELRLTRSTLEESRDRYQSLYDQAPVGYFSIDALGVVREVNLTACGLFGIARQLLIATPFSALVAQDLAAWLEALERLRRGDPVVQLEIQLRRRAEEPFFAALVLQPAARQPQGAAFVAAVSDISHHHRAAERLRFQAELVDASGHALLAVDAAGRIVYLNRQAATLYGCAPEGALGQPAHVVVGGTLPAPGVEVHRLDHRRLDGRTIPVAVTVRASTDLTGQPVSIVAIADRSEDERQERRLAEALDKAQASEQAKSMFLGVVSHELRTPLNAVLGFAQLLEYQPLTPDGRDFLKAIRESGSALLGLIDRLLDLSQMGHGGLAYHSMPTDVPSLVQDVASTFHGHAHAKGLILAWRVLGVEMPHIVIDARRLRQVLADLIANAVKFTDRGSIEVTTEVVRGLERAHLRLVVTDTGPGIPSDQIPQLGTDFMQVDLSLTRRHGGCGIGLALSRRIIEDLGGTLDVSSIPGKGTQVQVVLPVTLVVATVPAASRAVRAVTSVLVVEDDDANVRLLRRMLDGRGLDVVVARHGEEALARSEGRSFDLVLMDLRMPVMDGLETVRRWRDRENAKAAQRSRIIAVTADAAPEMPDLCRAQGFDDFLTKPIRHSDIIALLEGATIAG